MGIVNIDPKVLERPVLAEGQYGPGLQFNADVELTGFECPAEEKLPAYDPDGARGPYAYFGFKVAKADGKTLWPEEWVEIGEGSGRKIQDFLAAAGVELTDDGNGGFRFATEDVAPRKLNGIQMAAPRASKTTGTMFNGKVVAIIG